MSIPTVCINTSFVISDETIVFLCLNKIGRMWSESKTVWLINKQTKFWCRQQKHLSQYEKWCVVIRSPLTLRVLVRSTGTRCLYKKARDYARRPSATWSIMWSTRHPACLSSPPITSRHRPRRPTASAWTPHRKSLTVTGNVHLLSFLPLYFCFWSILPSFFKLFSLGKYQPLTLWRENKFHCKWNAS